MEDIIFYYIDGYHGGIRGHMPLGCWRDILEQLENYPEWKLSIDVEPVSWDCLRARDPVAYAQLKEMLRDQTVSSRLEIVGGSYGQPYCWITDGESNIRQLVMGLQEIRKHFPWIHVETYSAQEPCWTSAMPQILRSLGYQRAVLKDPSTAWGGYAEGLDSEICCWVGPDGSKIPAVPRYDCEELRKVWETESVTGDEDFAEKCMAHGIAHPAGMFYQDLGWPAKPQLSDKPGYEGKLRPDYLVYTTWKEYFNEYAAEAERKWRVTQEAFRVALPWGERLLVRMARQVRRGEIAVQCGERLSAIAWMTGCKRTFTRQMEEAWKLLLMAQHHDGWICASTGEHEENWAWKTSAQIYSVEALTENVRRDTMMDISGVLCPDENGDGGSEMLCVANLMGRAELCTIRAGMTSCRGTRGFRVYDGKQRLKSQYMPERVFPDGSINAGTLIFQTVMPGLSTKTLRIEPTTENDLSAGTCAAVMSDCACLENSFFKITFDLNAGGTIVSLYDKRREQELVSSNSKWKFNEYSGYFVEKAAFCSSAENRASARVAASGPVMAALVIEGRVGEVCFTQTVSLTENDQKIAVDVSFRFPEKTYVGEPHRIIPENCKEDSYRSCYDDRYKLTAFFPTIFSQKYICKDAAYDVCASELENTHFKTWNDIKHNILIGWVDVSDGNQGLAVFSDHTTSYIHGAGYPLGLTMAWGWDAGFWWGRRQLKGAHRLRYAIVPHEGNWRTGDLWHEYQKYLYSPEVQRAAGRAAASGCQKFITVSGQTELSAAYPDEEGAIMVRLFNPGEAAQAEVEIAGQFAKSAELVELNGESMGLVQAERHEDRVSVFVNIPEFGIRTLRITWPHEHT